MKLRVECLLKTFKHTKYIKQYSRGLPIFYALCKSKITFVDLYVIFKIVGGGGGTTMSEYS